MRNHAFLFLFWLALSGLCATTGPSAFAAASGPLTSTSRATRVEVGTIGSVPGFRTAELRRYLADEMEQGREGSWRFEPEAQTPDVPAPDRVEWELVLKPYAGWRPRWRVGMKEDFFGVHRPITVKARLYVSGVCRSSISASAKIQGGYRDKDLASLVERMSHSLIDTPDEAKTCPAAPASPS